LKAAQPVFFFAGSHNVDQAGLKIGSSCLSFQSAWYRAMHHHTQKVCCSSPSENLALCDKPWAMVTDTDGWAIGNVCTLS
jgi:hypothetical protein